MLKICNLLFCFRKTCSCLTILENIQISVNIIDRFDIIDEYSVKCDFFLNIVIFIGAALNISLRLFENVNVLWLYLFRKGVPNETKCTINLNKENNTQISRSAEIKIAALPGIKSNYYNVKIRNAVAYKSLLSYCSA